MTSVESLFPPSLVLSSDLQTSLASHSLDSSAGMSQRRPQTSQPLSSSTQSPPLTVSSILVDAVSPSGELHTQSLPWMCLFLLLRVVVVPLVTGHPHPHRTRAIAAASLLLIFLRCSSFCTLNPG